MFAFRRFSRLLSLAALLALVIALPVSVFAGEAVNTDKTGLAISGYDPVSYFVDGKPVAGNFQITAEYEGNVYRFANEANRDAFKAGPEKYLPQFGGYCAFGVAIDKKFTADPNVFVVVDGKLYLNLNKDIAAKFAEKRAEYIATAEKNWPTIADVPAREIK